MGWLIPVVFFFLFAGLALSGLVSQRIKIGPAGYWVAGWSVLALCAIAMSVPAPREVADVFLGFANPILPLMMFAGALHYAGRPIPRSIFVSGIVICCVQGMWTAQGMTARADLLALIVEPALCFSAALLVVPAARANGSLMQRTIAPGLVIVGIVETLDALAGVLDWMPWNPLFIWVMVGFPVVAMQLAAVYELVGQHLAETIDALRQAHSLMEDRVAVRTAQLREEVTERKRIEKELRISAERFRRISALMTDYAYSARIDRQGRFHTEWSTGAFARISGYESVGSIGDWKKVIHPDDIEKASACIAQALRGECGEFEFRISARSGETRWVAGRVIGERDDELGDLVIYTAGHDITEEKRTATEHQMLRDRVRDDQRLESLGALAGGVAHDFNNLLSVILGNATILQRDLPQNSPLVIRAERIRNSARYAAEITTQMLTYSGSASLEVEALDLTSLVGEMSNLLDAGTTRRVRIESNLDEALASIEGDRAQLRQVILNLISNASDALLGENGGVITLSTGRVDTDREYFAKHPTVNEQAEGEYVYLEVSDDGPGMNDETRARIFDPFYSTKQSGRGLGLAVVLGIVRAHSGMLSVASRLTEGTTFRVLFPIAQAQHVAQDESKAIALPRTKSLAGPQSATILVIDDEETVAEMTGIVLERAGYDVLVAGGGLEGLEIYEKNSDRIVLVVLDLTMPDLTGNQVLEELRKLNPELPIIISSGYTDRIAARKIGLAERTDFVQKPYEPDYLIERVRLLRGGLEPPVTATS
jgi:PAS domain S-box-containing protein